MARKLISQKLDLFRPETVGEQFIGYFQGQQAMQHGPCMVFNPATGNVSGKTIVPISDTLREFVTTLEVGDLCQIIFRGKVRSKAGQWYKSFRTYVLDDLTDAVDPNDVALFAAEDEAMRDAEGGTPEPDETQSEPDPVFGSPGPGLEGQFKEMENSANEATCRGQGKSK